MVDSGRLNVWGDARKQTSPQPYNSRPTGESKNAVTRLAIDPGPAFTGWAIEQDNDVRAFGARRFRAIERGRHQGWEAECAELFSRWLTWMVNQHRVGEILVEETFIGRNMPDVRWLGWAHVATALLCLRLGLEYRPIANGVLKRFATGDGRAKPRAMIAAARARGYLVETDHEADAIFMLLMSQDGALPGPLGRFVGAKSASGA